MKSLRSFVLPVILLAAVFSTGCKKDGQLRAKDFEGVAGDYDYQYSEGTGSYDDFNSIGNYGIRIKNSGKVHFFKDGKLISKGYLSDTEPTSSGYAYTTVFIMENEKTYHFRISGDQVTVKEFPVDYYNYFIRK